MRQTSWPIRCRLQDVAVPSRACTTPLLHSTTTGPDRAAVFLAVQRTFWLLLSAFSYLWALLATFWHFWLILSDFGYFRALLATF